jgi:UDP-N-acetylglucosamine 2-epimerase (non-hydrolysing)
MSGSKGLDAPVAHGGPVICVVGARPNFMKMAPILRAMAAHTAPLPMLLVHTGQHYDKDMSDRLFEDLQLPRPDVNLEVGSGTHAIQTAEVMRRFEPVVDEYKPACVAVVGDVNSTLACALVAVKKNIPVAHIKAGLRSHDRTMPEEINRILTDQISDRLYATERSAKENLAQEGIPESRVCFAGNVMIDSVVFGRANARDPKATLQASNVDPLILSHPQGYLEMLGLMASAAVVLTDSGGLQEETTALGVSCLTLRENTERPITVEQGSNILVGRDRDSILRAVEEILAGRGKRGRVPEFWDGHAAERITADLYQWLKQRHGDVSVRSAIN